MADEPKMSSQQMLIRRKISRRSETEVTREVLLGPKIDLHVGVHNAFAKLLSPDFQYSRRDCVHSFVMADEQHKSPFGSFHWGEFADFGPGQAIVHAARWPVLNRTAWVTDTDDFVYPVVCGRHYLSPDFRNAFRREWSTEFKKNVFMRVMNMLTAYAHPSCKAVFYRSESAVRDARRWIEELGVGELGEAYLSKIQVLYPAQESCSADTMEAKWRKSEPLTVVFCGRHYESKNGRMALEIFDRLSREFPTDRFVYIGNVPQEELRRRRERPTSLVHHQSLPHKQTLSVLNAAHILFHPSKFEGLGIIFLEAAASGMAVITATGGAMGRVEELFGTDGAILVDRNNIAQSEEASAFETHLRYVLRNPSVAKSMAYHNFKLATVGKLSAERSRRILLQVYEHALERPADTPLILGQIPYRDGSLLRLNCRQLDQEEIDYRRELNVTQVRFLL
jgi:glycosyltransferase involved in cell wall biosynthesis